jgi:DnaJ domain
MDPLLRAYAALELSPGASMREVRRQFKMLVRRWHPDRFAEDPQGQVEAAHRMREINGAYRLICDAGMPPAGPPPESSGGPTVAQPEPHEPITSHLSRSAIDGIVRSMGTESPIDVLLTFLAWSWPLFLALFITFAHRYSWALREQPGPSVALWWLLVGLALFLRFRQWRKEHRNP